MSIPIGFPPSGGYGAMGPGDYFLDEGRIALGLEGCERLPTARFGAEKWHKYFGDVGAEPPLPPKIREILIGPCPIWAGKRVEETHKLVLIPERVNGAPLTLTSLGELIKTSTEGHKTEFDCSDSVKEAHGENRSSESHWVLMTRHIIPGSRDKSYADQARLVARLGLGYQLPPVLDAAVCVLMEYVETGVRLFSDDPWTYTLCLELVNRRWAVFLGGFGSSGLNVGSNSPYSHIYYPYLGASALRMF